jgi:hypothetical protein
MKKNSNIESELNKIRADFYEKTKNMSSSERVAYLKAQIAPVHQKYGIQTVRGRFERSSK